MVEAKAAHLKNQRRFLDQLFAAQTAQLMSVEGKCLKAAIQPEECMAFNWDEKNQNIVTEMTEEDMTRFDQNMDAWGRGRSHG